MSDDTRPSNGAKLPFDLYDFFGYLCPGALLVVTALVLLQSFVDYGEVLASFSCPVQQQCWHNQWWAGLLILFLSFVLLYVAGHVVAALSATLIDRVFMKEIVGYPYARLLNLLSGSEHRSFTRPLDVYLLLSAHAACAAGIALVPLSPSGNCPASWTSSVLIAILHSAFIASLYAFGVLVLLRLTTKFLRGVFDALRSQRAWLDKATTRVLKVWAAPAQPLARGAEAFLEMFGVQPFGLEIADKFRAKFHEQFGLESGTAMTENFWQPYISVTRNDPSLRATLQHFLHLYGFARNISMACFISSAMVLGRYYCYSNHAATPALDSFPFFTVALVFYVLGWVMFGRYYYLYAGYYTKMMIRAFISQQPSEP